MLPSFVGSGKNTKASSGSRWIRLEAGKPMDIIPLTGVEAPAGETPSGSNCVISYRRNTMWVDDLPEGKFSPSFPALGTPDDPGVLLGLEPKFTGLMICAIKDDEAEHIWQFGVSIFKQLVDIEAALGESIKGHILRVTRKGEGKMTKYTVINTGRVVDVEGEPETNLVEHIGPTTREEIIKQLEEVGVWPPPGGDPFAAVASTSKSKGTKAKVSPKFPTKPKPEVAEADADDKDDWDGDFEDGTDKK